MPCLAAQLSAMFVVDKWVHAQTAVFLSLLHTNVV